MTENNKETPYILLEEEQPFDQQSTKKNGPWPQMIVTLNGFSKQQLILFGLCAILCV